MHGVWFRTVTIYKNNIWSVGLYEAYEDNGGSRTGALPRYHPDHPGVKKDAVFRKGHIITKEDIPVLLSVGKDTIYIWENDETMMHENEAAEVLYRMSACAQIAMRPTSNVTVKPQNPVFLVAPQVKCIHPL